MRGARETMSRAPSLHSRPGSGSAGARRHSLDPVQDHRRAIPLPGPEDRYTGAWISVVLHNVAVDPRKSPSLDRTRRPPPNHHSPALKSPAGPTRGDRQALSVATSRNLIWWATAVRANITGRFAGCSRSAPQSIRCLPGRECLDAAFARPPRRP